MRCNRSVMSTRYITLLLWLSVSLLAPGIVAAQNDNANGANGNSALAFWNSLTPAERKLPRDILVAQRLAAGKTVPPRLGALCRSLFEKPVVTGIRAALPSRW